MVRVRVKYSKLGRLAYISHLDLIRSIERTIRRSKIEAAMTEGFNPRIKLSFSPALGVGILSEAEYFDIYFHQMVETAQILSRLNENAPEGLKFLSATQLTGDIPQIGKSVKAAEYEIEFEAKGIDLARVKATLDSLLSKNELAFVKRGLERRVLTKEAVIRSDLNESFDNVYKLRLLLSLANPNEIGPDIFISLLFAELNLEKERIIDVRRIGQYAKIFDGFFESYE